MAVCAELTGETFAENPTLAALAGTVTDVGTVTAEALLYKLTLIPPLGAVALSVTLQASVPDPAIDELLHVIAFKAGAVVVPVPLRPTTVVAPVEESLATVSWPVAVPAVFGLNCKSTVAV